MKQALVVNIGLVAPINDIIPLAATIRSQKVGWAVRMKAKPVGFVEVRKVK